MPETSFAGSVIVSGTLNLCNTVMVIISSYSSESSLYHLPMKTLTLTKNMLHSGILEEEISLLNENYTMSDMGWSDEESQKETGCRQEL
jgi:hypothetical protein